MKELVKVGADGSLVIILLIGVVAALLWTKKVGWTRFLQTIPVVIMAGMTSLLAAKLFSLVYQPDSARPFIEKGLEAGATFIDNPGFPSDHVLLAMVVVGAVYFVTSYRRLAAVMLLLVIIMAVSRVLALVHTPQDVIGGFILALSGFAWYAKLKN